jgi:hypothetical protein
MRPEHRPLLQFSADLGGDAIRGVRITAVLAPDGTRLVPSCGTDDQRCLIRLLNQPTATALIGTEGAEDPFFRPDSRIGFPQRAKKISVVGGTAITL